MSIACGAPVNLNALWSVLACSAQVAGPSAVSKARLLEAKECSDGRACGVQTKSKLEHRCQHALLHNILARVAALAPAVHEMHQSVFKSIQHSEHLITTT